MNIGKINPAILINRSIEKHKISDYKLASHVESFWTRTKWPEYFFSKGKTTQEIIKDELPRILTLWLDYTTKQKDIRFWERVHRKFKKYMAKELKRIKKARDPQRKRREFVHKYINTVKAFYQDMIDKEGWTPYYAKNRLKLFFGFVEIPKWIWQSDKQIERKLDAIIDEIVFSFHIKQQRINPLHDCLEFNCPYCKERKRSISRISNQHKPKGYTTLTQDNWDTLAELKGKKPWRWQLKFDYGIDEREQALQDALEDNNERGDQ